MTDDEVCRKAVELGATYSRFKQGDVDGGLCTAYTCWWIRRRLKGHDAWSKKFYHAPAGLYPDGKTWHAEWHTAHETWGGKEAFIKARQLQQRLIGDEKAQQDYVTGKGRGIVARIDPAKDINAGGAVDSRDAQNLANAFMVAGTRQCIAKFGIHTGEGHAVGLDFRTPYPVYFDPNLGEFTFNSSRNVFTWWQHCYERQRDQGRGEEGAFDVFVGQRFEVTYYK